MLSLDQALAELPDTADGIAAFLTEKGIRGATGDGACCPLANYLLASGDFADPFVCDEFVTDDYVNGHRDAPTPEIVEFVKRFDKGEWPELVADV